MAPAALPTELVNLLALHSSFLTALSLHYAHNGTATPVDLRVLIQSISAVWQKRKVTIDDVRLCVGVLGAGPSGANNPFHLSDYSRGKICLELREEHRMNGTLGPLNEEALQAMFMQSLDALWRRWIESQTPISARPIATPKRRGRPRKTDAAQKTIQTIIVDDTSISKFLSQLPHAEITLCTSVKALAPLQEKGRKRLRELTESAQHGRTAKKPRETTTTTTTIGKENEPSSPQAQPKITAFASVRKSALLDRILAKQAALQRCEEVLGVLALLAAGKGSGAGARVSFSLSALVQSLQTSMRSPLSKEEVLRCVEVLAAEVAPGYVSIVRMGAMNSVVVNSGLRPVDVRGRLARLGVAV